MIKNIKYLILVSLTFMACNNDDNDASEEVPVVSGSAVFGKYVALGDSFAAGHSDGALFKKGQEGAYTNILAQQFVAAGGGAFTIPYTGDNIGGLLLNGNVVAGPRLYFNGSAPVSLTDKPTTEVTAKATGPFNNLSVPGAKSFHLLASGYGNVAGVATGTANPYYARFASSATASVLADALAQAPTFFSLWIGGNDVLSYASSGGAGKDQKGNLDPSTYGTNDITDPIVFANAYNTLATSLTTNGAKGVVANLPYINTLPYFTTVPFNPLTTSSLGGGNTAVGIATIQQLNSQLYGPLKQALTAFGAGDRINLLSETGSNPLLIKDETLTDLSAQLTAAFTPALGAQTATFYGQIFGKARQTRQTADFKDYVLLPTRTLIGTAPTATNSGLGMAPPAPLDKFGVTYPLQDKDVLVQAEVQEIKAATDAYNVTIESVAKSKGLAFVDTRPIMNQLSNGGISFGNFSMSATYVTGGAFSLDGIHPSARGYALVANIFIDAINAQYQSTLRKVDLAKYPIQYPKTIN